MDPGLLPTSPPRWWLLRAATLAIWTVVIAGAGLLAAAASAKPKAPIRWVGNRAETIAHLPPCGPAESFRFAVIGDPEDGLPTFERLLPLIRERRPAFLLITGDCVKRASRSRYERFIAVIERQGWKIPLSARWATPTSMTAMPPSSASFSVREPSGSSTAAACSSCSTTPKDC